MLFMVWKTMMTLFTPVLDVFFFWIRMVPNILFNSEYQLFYNSLTQRKQTVGVLHPGSRDESWLCRKEDKAIVIREIK